MTDQRGVVLGEPGSSVEQLDLQLQHLADHDPLTGLRNRRSFEAELDRHVETVERSGPCGALLLFDLDRFKTINDTLGHSAGDYAPPT